MPRLPADVSKKLREWQKKINLDPEVKNLYRAFSGGGSHRAAQLGKGKSSIKRSVPFLSVSAKSHMGANAEITIPSLKLEEIDWDQELYATVMNAQKK
jgi:hypothetical protein